MSVDPAAGRAACRFGLFLNMGANLAARPEEIFAFTLEQADLAERLGLHDLWLSEHHFIPFGLDPSALTAAGFLLGRTRRLRVGTAVVLAPLLEPIDLAERAALLDQMSGGRFDLGLGRGGYLRDYEVFGVDTKRWDEEPVRSLSTLLDLWSGNEERRARVDVGGAMRVEPQPFSPQGPPLFAATSSPGGLAFAARNGLPLQHYFAMPAQGRVAVEAQYEKERPDAVDPPEHLHTLIVHVTSEPDRDRERLREALTTSFQDGDWPAVPGAEGRHRDADGNPVDRAAMATGVADGAILGDPQQVAEALRAFIDTTGARRIALYAEAIADREATLASIERFAKEVAPRLQGGMG
ncbi:MAG: LLM class flavin-dependent oxidoreductase [Myxococcota bacterium]